jgi:[protein-PII] uridylyltransferase
MAKQTSDGAAAGRVNLPAAEPRHPATDLAAASRQLLGSGSHRLDAPALREALVDLHELWLTTKAAEIGITSGSGFALVATGGLGRREMVPYSDLDLMLLHNGMPAETVTEVAEQLWYPLWDANIRLDHSVRTVSETLQVAGSDISAGLAVLEARHIAGDDRLSGQLISGARRQWRVGIASRFDDLVDLASLGRVSVAERVDAALDQVPQ